MPTEVEIVDQLAEYCEWLETELSAPMHRSRVVVPRSSGASGGGTVVAVSTDREGPARSRRLMAVAAAALVAATVTAVYGLRRDGHTVKVAPPPIEQTDDGPTIAPSIAPSTLPSRATEAAGYAPVNLPDGLVVWDVGWATTGGTYGAPFSEQLFGSYDSTNTLAKGMLLRIQSSVDEVLPELPRVTVRGVQGYQYPVAGDPVSLMWVEGGREISVRARGITVDEALAMLDALQWRTDGSNTFEPTSISLPLLSEVDSGKEFRDDQTSFSITDADGPTPVNGQLASDVALVEVKTTVMGALAPEFVFDGERRADGSVVSTRSHVILEPDGSIVQITGGIIDDDATLTDRVMAAMQPIDRAGLTALVDAANERIGRLPEVAIAAIPNGQIVLRGGTAESPVAICLEIDQTERCRSSSGLQQMEHWQNSVLIDRRWFLIGRQPATDPAPVVFPWTFELSPRFPQGRTIAPTRALVVDDQLLWYAEIPEDLDAVGVGYVDNGEIVQTTPTLSPRSGAARRPDS